MRSSLGAELLQTHHVAADIPEEELAERIEAMAWQVEGVKNCIFNTHPPPYDSGIDTAPKVPADLKPVIEAGGIQMIPWEASRLLPFPA